MIKIGISGGIGSGKSTVCHFFNILGIPVYNSDKQAKYIMRHFQPVKNAIIKEFGAKAYNGDNINVEYMGKKIFNNESARKVINSIVHPVVKDDFTKWSNNQKHAKYIIQESALLFESRRHLMFNKTITISSSIEDKIERIVKRDNISKTFAITKIKSQISDTKRESLADFIIINNKQRLLIPQILNIHNKIIKETENGEIQ